MTDAAETRAHQLVIERIDLAHGRDVKQLATQNNNVLLEGALGRNQRNDQRRHVRINRIPLIKPGLEGGQLAPVLRLVCRKLGSGRECCDRSVFAMQALRPVPQQLQLFRAEMTIS